MAGINIKEILERTVKHFEEYDIPNPRLDAEVLLADLLEMERIRLYVNFDQPLTSDEIDEYRRRVVLRSKRVPVQYIVGNQEFMSIDFKVDKNVLIPRPETEHLVETVIEFIEENNIENPLIADVGTGSGAIAVSLAYHVPSVRVLGVDISPEALKVAKENAERYNLRDRVKFLKGSYLEPIKEKGFSPNIIVSNPPYFKKEDFDGLQPEVEYEPRLALDGGNSGYEAYQQIISQSEILVPGGLLAFEVGEGQAAEVASLMKNKFEQIEIIPDLAGIDRVVKGRKS